MKARLSAFAALLVTGGAAAAIAAAPAALAQPNCATTSQGAGGATEVCESPGNAQISATPGQYAQPWYGGGMFPWEGYGPYIF
ncbi:hypothetical protein [Mycobacterium sp. 236(2023)]|uniref:hypothetical protein n=1 Tax=Mycobacterium sp. 236(2023) TaxID=3038163 RepID=UPI002414F6B9|nr:hypothetical protein [Mycobacterium sp. 236(2023)]MDG4665781.1 hypothetical protein [Mycobacterium sp. 236(2023)]